MTELIDHPIRDELYKFRHNKSRLIGSESNGGAFQKHGGWRRLRGLRKAFTVFVIVALSSAVGIVGAKLHSRSRWASHQLEMICLDTACVHLGARMMAIESVIHQRGSTPSYLVVGDSTAEFADLPTICGRQPINAGISWATVRTFEGYARHLADLSNPDFIVVALGTNDVLRGTTDGLSDRLSVLLESLSGYRVLLVPVIQGPGIPEPQAVNQQIAAATAPAVRLAGRVETLDGVHPSAQGYMVWKNSIVEKATSLFCGQT
jgi:lysophospholipase L1-like esterase